ncbi:hypothetical protein PsalN5692_03596 (plasmid) [Piscirickettsia salmonis]|nr:hypothetical protein PsalN5692_02846 [Piscirickettsia salmonis]QGP52088.1 hypothetical protein PsalN5692_03596 [Piscirickettsia salmonis]
MDMNSLLGVALQMTEGAIQISVAFLPHALQKRDLQV